MQSTPARGGIHHLRENDDLQVKIANLTRKLEANELKKVNEVTVVPKVPSVPMGSGVEESCIICDGHTHSTINCPNLPQVKGAIQVEQANALNPNFSWRNEGGQNHLANNQGQNFQNQGFPNQAP